MKRWILAAGYLLAVHTAASAQTVTGTWKGEYDSGVSGNGDQVRVTRRSVVTLILEQKGDSVFGNWAAQPAPPDSKPITLSGKVTGSTLRITTGTRDVPVVVDGKQETRRVRTDWTGTVSANEITGTMTIYVGGNDDPPRRNWRVVRQR